MLLTLCNLDAVGGPLGAEMELLLDVALTVEQQQSDGSLQHQKAFEASAGSVVPVGFRNTVKRALPMFWK